LLIANDLTPATINELIQDITYAALAVLERVEQLLERHGLFKRCAVSDQDEQVKGYVALAARQVTIFPRAYLLNAIGKRALMLT